VRFIFVFVLPLRYALAIWGEWGSNEWLQAFYEESLAYAVSYSLSTGKNSVEALNARPLHRLNVRAEQTNGRKPIERERVNGKR